MDALTPVLVSSLPSLETSATDAAVLLRYCAGFNECAQEVNRYLTSVDPSGLRGGSAELRLRLMSHLADYISSASSSSPGAAAASRLQQDVYDVRQINPLVQMTSLRMQQPPQSMMHRAAAHSQPTQAYAHVMTSSFSVGSSAPAAATLPAASGKDQGLDMMTSPNNSAFDLTSSSSSSSRVDSTWTNEMIGMKIFGESRCPSIRNGARTPCGAAETEDGREEEDSQTLWGPISDERSERSPFLPFSISPAISFSAAASAGASSTPISTPTSFVSATRGGIRPLTERNSNVYNNNNNKNSDCSFGYTCKTLTSFVEATAFCSETSLHQLQSESDVCFSAAPKKRKRGEEKIVSQTSGVVKALEMGSGEALVRGTAVDEDEGEDWEENGEQEEAMFEIDVKDESMWRPW